MSEFVFCHVDLSIGDGRFRARLLPEQVWYADEPVVLAYPGYFSRTPVTVQSLTGRPQPGIQPLDQPVPYGVPPLQDPTVVDPTELMDEISRADADVTREAVAAVRRGPGRPRKDQGRG